MVKELVKFMEKLEVEEHMNLELVPTEEQEKK